MRLPTLTLLPLILSHGESEQPMRDQCVQHGVATSVLHSQAGIILYPLSVRGQPVRSWAHACLADPDDTVSFTIHDMLVTVLEPTNSMGSEGLVTGEFPPDRDVAVTAVRRSSMRSLMDQYARMLGRPRDYFVWYTPEAPVLAPVLLVTMLTTARPLLGGELMGNLSLAEQGRVGRLFAVGSGPQPSQQRIEMDNAGAAKERARLLEEREERAESLRVLELDLASAVAREDFVAAADLKEQMVMLRAQDELQAAMDPAMDPASRLDPSLLLSSMGVPAESQLRLWLAGWTDWARWLVLAALTAWGCLNGFRLLVSRIGETAGARIEKVMACSICFEAFADEPTSSTPRNMACGHTFCQGCLELMLVKLPREGRATHKTLPCPTCRVETRVPDGKAEMLIKNFLALG